jgi:two-component system NtrC family sensor kinase
MAGPALRRGTAAAGRAQPRAAILTINPAGRAEHAAAAAHAPSGAAVTSPKGWNPMTLLRLPPQSIRDKIDQLSARAEALETQLVQSQRLATLGTLSMIMAHEVNNQLMTIMNRADVALGAEAGDMMHQALEKIVSSSEMASTMIRNMMGFAAATAKAPQRLEAHRLVEDTLNLMARPPAKDGIQIERRYDEGLHVEGPPVELTQIVLNLLINATQAMAEGGGTLTLRVYAEGDYVAFDVADTGPGIPPDHLEKIFDPFFTTKPERGAAGGGTGLGLYISRKIARDQGGDIAVLSRPGDGATFTVYLPRAE